MPVWSPLVGFLWTFAIWHGFFVKLMPMGMGSPELVLFWHGFWLAWLMPGGMGKVNILNMTLYAIAKFGDSTGFLKLTPCFELFTLGGANSSLCSGNTACFAISAAAVDWSVLRCCCRSAADHRSNGCQRRSGRRRAVAAAADGRRDGCRLPAAAGCCLRCSEPAAAVGRCRRRLSAVRGRRWPPAAVGGVRRSADAAAAADSRCSDRRDRCNLCQIYEVYKPIFKKYAQYAKIFKKCAICKICSKN